MKIKLFRGYHKISLREEIADAFEKNHLLVVCSPGTEDFSIVQELEKAEWKEQPVLGVFTSGTISGQPRLVLYSRENIESSLSSILAVFDEKRITSVFCYPQPFHTFGLLLGYVLSLKKNIPLYLPEGKYSQDSHRLRLDIQDPGVLTLGTPTHFFDLIEYSKKSGIVPTPSYSCIIGGAPVTVSMWKQIQTALKIEKPSIGYGCTEASPGITHHPPGLMPKEDGEIGFPLPSLQSRVTEQGVQIHGPSLCLAMTENGQFVFPEATTIRDSIKVRDDGMWVYQGRLDLMLNRGGMKISLEAIEQKIFLETGLHVVATPVTDERLGQDLAILAKRDGTKKLEKLNLILMKEFGIKLKEHLLFETLDFPMNESFKLDRKAIALICRPAVPTASLAQWIPHKPPMVWIDQVLSYGPQGGECAVKIQNSGAYLSNGELRPSSVIEFIAQAQAFMGVCAAKDNPAVKPFKEAFLVSVTNTEFESPENFKKVSAGDTLIVKVGASRQMGPIFMFSGSVWTENNQCLGKANLKAFMQ